MSSRVLHDSVDDDPFAHSIQPPSEFGRRPSVPAAARICLAPLHALSLIIRLGPYIGPQLIEFFRAEHAAPRRHLALALRGGLVETRPFVGAEPSQIKDRAGVHQSFSMTLRTMGSVELRPGFDQGPILCRCAWCSRQHTEDNAYSQARLHETWRRRVAAQRAPRARRTRRWSCARAPPSAWISASV